MGAFIDLRGKRFGRWLVEDGAPDVVEKRGRRYVAWYCVCDCGALATVRAGNLGRGLSRSCGCLRREVARTENLKPGHSPWTGKASSEYRAWAKAKQRCHNPKDPKYPGYGGRGITMCERWRDSFENFIANMGRKPRPENSIRTID